MTDELAVIRPDDLRRACGGHTDCEATFPVPIDDINATSGRQPRQ
jgi:hypothetical protein